MEQGLWKIDEWKYVEHDGQALLVRGWFLNRKSGWICRLYADGQPGSPLEMKSIPRPDVARQYPSYPDALASGFEVRVPGIWQLAETCKTLELVLESGEEKNLLLSWREGSLKKELEKALLEWHVEATDLVYRTMLSVRGWVYSQRGRAEVSIQDLAGVQVQAKITKSRRPDVAKALGLPEEEKNRETGFSFLVNLEEVRGKVLQVEFENAYTRQAYRIDVSRLLSQSTPMGKRRRVLSWENREKNIRILKEKGVAGFLHYVDQEAGLGRGDYEDYLRAQRPGLGELLRQRKMHVSYQPLISIVVPLYNTPLPYVKALLDGIHRQTYTKWQLCLADGSDNLDIRDFIHSHYRGQDRICYEKLPENLGISGNTNWAVKKAKGEYILFADHDDEFEPDALFQIVQKLNQSPRPDLVYTDEDKISMDGRHHFAPHFKSDFNLFRLRENNYICHIFVVRREILRQAGLLKPAFDGAQDYDLILRCCEKAQVIGHVPKVLYHWRSHMESTAADPESKRYAYEAGRRALKAHYARLGLEAEVEMQKEPGWYRSRVAIQGNPMVSIIIPTRDHGEELKTCIKSILDKTSWKNYEILVTDNQSQEEETFLFYRDLEKEPHVRLLSYDHPFNFSAINNYAAREARGTYLLFLNNDTQILTPNWLEEMLMICQQPQVGAVGAKLLYPDGTLQHAGIVLGLGGVAGHIYCQGAAEIPGYMGRLMSVQEVSAVTAACMMVKTKDFFQVEGFEEKLAVAFNDVDLCMKLGRSGQKVVFTPHSQLVHFESKSRGLEDTPEKQLRFAAETKFFQERWAQELKAGDPYYNPNLSLTEGDCSLSTGAKLT